MLDDVKRVILVLSGKGGVGKSTVSTQLALTLKESGFKDMLLEVMRHSVALIENKSTDTNTNQRKSMEWLIIQKRLAELTGKQRDVWQLKGFWRRLKMHAKKNVSDYKQAVKTTGEGLIVLSLSEDDQKVINLCPAEFEDKSNDGDEKNESHNNTMYDIGYNEDILNGVLEPVTEIKYEEPQLQIQRHQFESPQPIREQFQARNINKMRRRNVRPTPKSKVRALLKNIDTKKLNQVMMKEEHKLKMRYHRQELGHQKMRHKMELAILTLEQEKKELEISVLKKNLEQPT